MFENNFYASKFNLDEFSLAEYSKWQEQVSLELKKLGIDPALLTHKTLDETTYHALYSPNLEHHFLPGHAPYRRGFGVLAKRESVARYKLKLNDQALHSIIEKLAHYQVGIIDVETLECEAHEFEVLIDQLKSLLVEFNFEGQVWVRLDEVFLPRLVKLNLLSNELIKFIGVIRFHDYYFYDKSLKCSLDQIVSQLDLALKEKLDVILLISNQNLKQHAISGPLSLSIMVASFAELVNKFILNQDTVDTATLLNCIHFELSFESQLFEHTVEIRSLREALYHVLRLLDLDDLNYNFDIHVTSGVEFFSMLDIWSNIFRNTTCCMAGLMNQASSIALVCHDELIKVNNLATDVNIESSLELALNTFNILLHESHLPQVIDPMGGSFLIENKTNEMVKLIWQKLCHFSKHEELLKALRDQNIISHANKYYEEKSKQILNLKRNYAGINNYALIQKIEAAPPVKSIAIEQIKTKLNASVSVVKAIRSLWDEDQSIDKKSLIELLKSELLNLGSLAVIESHFYAHGDTSKALGLSAINYFSQLEAVRLELSSKYEKTPPRIKLLVLENEAKLAERNNFGLNIFSLIGVSLISEIKESKDLDQLDPLFIYVLSDFDSNYLSYFDQLDHLKHKFIILGATKTLDDQLLKSKSILRLSLGVDLVDFFKQFDQLWEQLK
jgi:hypothetical protein